MTKKQAVFNEALLNELAKNFKTQDDLFGPEGLFKQLMKAVLEKSLNAGLINYLGYEKHERSEQSNARNGSYTKVIQGEFDYLPEIRKVIYTTNAIESLNMTLRKFIKNKSGFPF